MDQTIEELEGEVWGPPGYDSSLVQNVHRLRKKSIDQFTIEDLRLMIGQNVGTRHLLPRALDLLEEDPLVEDYHYPGELLVVVMQRPDDYWRGHPDYLQRATGVVEAAQRELERRKSERAAQPAFSPGEDLGGADKHEAWLLHGITVFLSRHLAD